MDSSFRGSPIHIRQGHTLNTVLAVRVLADAARGPTSEEELLLH